MDWNFNKMTEQGTHFMATVIPALPPITITTLTLFGVPLSQWVLLATLIYTILLIIGWVHDRFFKHRGKK
jgi:hypothetical protein